MFLLVGGATSFFYVISNYTDPKVEADINRHFASLRPDTQNSALPIENPNFVVSPSQSPSYIETSAQAKTNTGKNGRQKKKTNRREKADKKKTTTNRNRFTQTKPGITQIAPGTFLIQETTIATARKNLNKYIDGAVATLAEDKTGPIGFKIKNIKKNSYLRAIGLRNKDIIIAINGHRLNNVEKVTMAIASFKFSTQFRLDLIRKDQKQSLYYRIIEQ